VVEPLAFLADLAADLARAHSAQRVVEVLFAALADRAAAREVVLWYPTAEGGGREISCGARGVTTVASASPMVGAASARVAPLLDDGGIIIIRASANAEATALDDSLLRAIAAIVSSSVRHVEVLDRVAKLSRRAHVEARELRRRLVEIERSDEVVVASASTKRLLREVVPAVARHDTTVLLRGETGTGKEVLARRIHALSRRNNRAFVQINCGAIPEALIESTLFGHERGSFTGALARHVGVFERAHLGTLLLDEIGDLPPAAQVKLLRVLQGGALERVGGDRSVTVDVRVIAATNRALEAMVAAGTFREDLYYRISVFPIEIAPLRDRAEDIDALTTAFVARAARRMGIEPPAIPESVRRKLRRHTWPGNVRELENAIERALVLGAGSELRVSFPLASASDARGAVAIEPLAAVTKRTIERALTASDRRIYGAGGAAALLGLKPSTLQSKMEKLGITRDPP
jgi:formate hydrogenlyase transcriptional activator